MKFATFMAIAAVRALVLIGLSAIFLVSCNVFPALKAVVPINPSATATVPAVVSPAVPPTAATRSLPTALRMSGREPLTLDPALSIDVMSAAYLVEVFGGLVMLDRNLSVVPDLAERWETNTEGTVYTFHLRNAKFHDGRRVTAQDFKYSIERAADPQTNSSAASLYLNDIVGVNDKLSGKASSVRGVRVVDDSTLEIAIDAPKSYFLAKLSAPAAFVVDKNNIEKGGADWTLKPNGTGPYKLKEYIPKQRLVLIKNDNYYLDPKPRVAEVQVFFGEPGNSQLESYVKGELDVAEVFGSAVPSGGGSTASLSKEAVVVSQLMTEFLMFNTRMPPFDDPKVRQAFALAIDRRRLVNEVYKYENPPAKSILPPGMPGYNASLPEIAYDVGRAKQLLAESKYAGKLPTIIWGIPSANQGDQSMADMLKANLGVNIQFKTDDNYYSTAGTSSNPYSIIHMSWFADYADPENFIAGMFRSQSSVNASGYSNPDVDKLIDQAAVERDPQQRIRLYQQAESKILQDWPLLPLLHSSQTWLVKPYVQGLVFPAAVVPRLRFVSIER